MSIRNLLGAVLVCCSLSLAEAAQTDSQFFITAELSSTNVVSNAGNPAVPSTELTGFCIKNAGPNRFGATLTVVCTTDAAVNLSSDPWLATQGDAYRTLIQINREGGSGATIDSYAGTGNVTSWRVIDLPDNNYLELQVNW